MMRFLRALIDGIRDMKRRQDKVKEMGCKPRAEPARNTWELLDYCGKVEHALEDTENGHWRVYQVDWNERDYVFVELQSIRNMCVSGNIHKDRFGDPLSVAMELADIIGQAYGSQRYRAEPGYFGVDRSAQPAWRMDLRSPGIFEQTRLPPEPYWRTEYRTNLDEVLAPVSFEFEVNDKAAADALRKLADLPSIEYDPLENFINQASGIIEDAGTEWWDAFEDWIEDAPSEIDQAVKEWFEQLSDTEARFASLEF